MPESSSATSPEERPPTGAQAPSRWRSIEAAAFAGIVFSVCSVWALYILAAGPRVGASDAEILDYYTGQSGGFRVILGLNLAVYAATGFIYFIGVIRQRLGPNEPRFFSTVFTSGGLLYVALNLTGLVALVAPAVLVEIGERDLDPGAAALTRSFGSTMLFFVVPRLQATFIGATASLALRTGALPKWLIYLSLLLAVYLFVDFTFFNPSSLVFPIWVGVVSLWLLVGRPAAEADEAGRQ